MYIKLFYLPEAFSVTNLPSTEAKLNCFLAKVFVKQSQVLFERERLTISKTKGYDRQRGKKPSCIIS